MTSKRNRVFVGILAIFALGIAYLLYRVSADLDPRYQESAEESLVETTQLLAAFIESGMKAANWRRISYGARTTQDIEGIPERR